MERGGPGGEFGPFSMVLSFSFSVLASGQI